MPLPSPAAIAAHSELARQRAVLHLIAEAIEVELLPLVVEDGAPAWLGAAKSSFDARRHELAARLRRASALLESAVNELTAAEFAPRPSS